jgi:hypothetical protein
MAEYEPNSGIEFWFDIDGLLETVLGPKAELRDYSAYMCEGNVSQFRELHTNYYFEMRNGVAAFPVITMVS